MLGGMRAERTNSVGLPALILGFEDEILAELRTTLDVRLVVSNDPSADITWKALQYLTLDPMRSVWCSEQQECFAYVKSFFFQFADIYSRRYHYVSEHVQEIQNAFILSFNICYRIIKDRNIALLVFSNMPHEGYDYIFYCIAKHLNLKIVMCYQSLFPNRFFLSSDMEDFGKFLESPAISDFEKSNYALPDTWFYMRGRPPVDRSYQFKTMVSETLRNPRGVRVALMRHYYAARYRGNVAALTKKPADGEKYIYFPLHFQPELSTSALGGNYADQLTGIEVLSGLIPDDYRIYVKEHPRQTELQRGPLFFKRLNALGNVKLVARDLSSVDLINGSAGVATITGTAGWEALFKGKPVLIFGRAWYLEIPGVTTYCPELDFEAFVGNIPPSAERIVEALDDLLTRAGRGVTDPGYSGLVPSFDRASNARSVCQSIAAYLHKAPSPARDRAWSGA